MPKFTFTSPEGKTYDVEGPEGATKEQAFQILQGQIGAGTAKPTAPAQPPQSMAGFVGGNIAKGVAQTVGPYAEMARKAVNIPSDLVNRAIESVMGKGGPRAPKAAPTEVSAEALTEAGKKAGAITPSAEPRTTAQRYGAAALQALPAAAMPGAGANLAGRIGGAVGGGLGGEAGSQFGPGGQILGSILGGAAGGMAGAQRGIPKPPTEARAASERAGIPLTLGQESGNASLRFIENRLRELFPSAGLAEKDAMRQVTAGVRAVDKLADQISAPAGVPGALLEQNIGEKLRNAYQKTATKLDTLRDAQATKDYGVVRKLAGDKPVVNYKNTLATIDKIIAENQNVPAADAKKILAQAESMKKALTETAAGAPPSKILGPSGQPLTPAGAPTTSAATHTINDAMKTRSAWGKAARRSGNLFSDIDPNANQVLAKRLFGAINRDFEDAGKGAGEIATALKAANDNYRKASQSLTFMEKSALGKLIGEDVVDAMGTGVQASTKAPEAIAKKYLAMEPSQAKSVTAILQLHAPEVLQDAKAFVLRNGLEKARNTAEGQPPISFAKFRTQMAKVSKNLEAMGFSKKEIADIKDVTDTMARAGDKLGTNPSKTAAAASAGGIGTLALTGHIPAAVSAVVTPYIAAKALLTPQGRDLLRTVSTATDGAKRAAAIGALRSAYGPATQTPAPLDAGETARSPAEALGIPAPPSR